jgi:hypothetical protein
LSELRFYLDENVPLVVAEQLARSGIDAVSVHSLDRLGDTDEDHLQRATAMGRMLCTHDQDFLRITATGIEHAGIAFADQYNATIGGWVRGLRALHARMSAEEAVRHVEFLPMP